MKGEDKKEKKTVPEKDPGLHPDAVPEIPLTEVEDHEIEPDEDPFENPPPYEKAEPGEGP